MGLFGGGNSTNNTNQYDQRQLIDSHDTTSTTNWTDNSTYTEIDGGAIDAGRRAFELADGLAEKSLTSGEAYFARALDLTEKTLQTGNDQQKASLLFAQGAQAESANTIKQALASTSDSALKGFSQQLIIALAVAIAAPYVLKAMKS